MNCKTLGTVLFVIAAVLLLGHRSHASDVKRFQVDIVHPPGPTGHRDAALLAVVLEKRCAVLEGDATPPVR